MRFASLGHYRLSTFEQLASHFGPEELEIQAGDRSPDGTVQVLSPLDFDRISSLRNVYLPKQILVQLGGFRSAWNASTLVLDLNPRVLNSWLLLTLRRAARRRTLVWGHAWPRTGSATKPGLIRGLMRKLSNGVITYTAHQARELSEKYPGLRAFPAPNALYRREKMYFTADRERNVVIYVGRLVLEKKVDALLNAFAQACRSSPKMRLVIIGEGPERSTLEHLATSLGIEESTDFMGVITDVEVLRGQYSRSFVSVSPGYAGLSVTQSLAFGVPILVSLHEPHAPEISALEPGFNGQFFNGVESLAANISDFYASRASWESKGSQISAQCAKEFSVEAMAEGVIAALAAG